MLNKICSPGLYIFRNQRKKRGGEECTSAFYLQLIVFHIFILPQQEVCCESEFLKTQQHFDVVY